jgi:hypothetical protein
MRRKFLILALAVAAILAIGSAPASAITDGEYDGNGHPNVGLMVAKSATGRPLWRCSGALLSPTVFLTAGHCTTPPAARAEIWFDPDVESGIPANGYPFRGEVAGTTYLHPNFDPFVFARADLGVVVLDRPVVVSTYGALPELDELDALATRRGQSEVSFTTVGYGLQQSFPDPASFLEHNVRRRMVAHPHLIQINTARVGDYSILLSNNASTGGACFGDSGGPNFIGDTNVIAGVTSYVLNGNCAGTGGVYRIDRADDLDWLARFLD